MAVPAHDERLNLQQLGLPIVEVVEGGNVAAEAAITRRCSRQLRLLERVLTKKKRLPKSWLGLEE